MSTTVDQHEQRPTQWSSLIRDVADFPQPGVVYKDITPLLGDGPAFAAAVADLVATAPPQTDVVVGMEARGFILAAPVALALGVGFVPVRKTGKLPADTVERSYALEYGEATLAMHTDAIRPGSKVLILDDVLATGGTVVATAELVRSLGAEVVGVLVLLELTFLPGRATLAEHGLTEVTALVSVGGS